MAHDWSNKTVDVQISIISKHWAQEWKSEYLQLGNCLLKKIVLYTPEQLPDGPFGMIVLLISSRL